MIEISRKTFRDIDWLLLMAPLALTIFGCIGIYSTTAPNTDLVKKQIIALIIGLAIAFGVMFTDYRKIITEIAPFIYGAVMFMLVLVLFIGVSINGNKAWLHIPGLPSIQPSEFAKVATILMLARYVSQRRGNAFTLRDAVIMAGITLPPIILIALEHDTGTMLTFGAILGVFYFLAGMPKKFLIAGILAVPLALIAVYPHLKGYQKERIDVILHPEQADPRGYAYQTIQSVIAVGSGGPTGKGVGNGTQGQLGFLPYAYSDFIAAVIGEETGFVGILIMMALYLIFIWRLIDVAVGARDKAGAMMIMGFVALITFHILCNLGMVIGIMPIMGIPLPLMSQGGTAIMSMFAGVGLALSVRFRRFVN
jgi:rod shape determining protein RodA